MDEDESKQSWTAASVSQAPQQLQCVSRRAARPAAPRCRCPEPPVPACSALTRRSAERKPDEFLYLLVRAGGAWQFPQAEHRAGETARQARSRLVRSRDCGAR